MTVHKAKGLEWPVVVLPDVTAGVFPTTTGRPRWTQSAKTLPSPLRGDAADFPVVTEWTNKGIEAFQADDQGARPARGTPTRLCRRDAGQAPADRLGALVGSYPVQAAWAVRSSSTRSASTAWPGWRAGRPLGAAAGGGAPTPALDVATTYIAGRRRPTPDVLASAAYRRGPGARRVGRSPTAAPTNELDLMTAPRGDPVQSDLLADWDRDLAALLVRGRGGAPPLPRRRPARLLSASAVLRLAADPEGLARDLARPMPAPPRAAARRGTRFHAWVEAQFGVQPLLDRLGPRGRRRRRARAGSTTSWGRCGQAFLAGPYAARAAPSGRGAVPARPRGAGGPRPDRRGLSARRRQLRGRRLEDRAAGADPLQLARLSHRLGADRRVCAGVVGAVFYYVASGRVERPEGLPTAEELATLLT